MKVQMNILEQQLQTQMNRAGGEMKQQATADINQKLAQDAMQRAAEQRAMQAQYTQTMLGGGYSGLNQAPTF